MFLTLYVNHFESLPEDVKFGMCGFHDFFRLEEQPLASPLYDLWNMFYQDVSLSAKVDIKFHVDIMSLFPKARMDNFRFGASAFPAIGGSSLGMTFHIA